MITLYQAIKRGCFVHVIHATRIEDPYFYKIDESTGKEVRALCLLANANSACYSTEAEARAAILKDHEEWVCELERELARVRRLVIELKTK